LKCTFLEIRRNWKKKGFVIKSDARAGFIENLPAEGEKVFQVEIWISHVVIEQ